MQDTSHLDWGVYTCQAHNDIGNNEAAVVLKGNVVTASHLHTDLLGG